MSSLTGCTALKRISVSSQVKRRRVAHECRALFEVNDWNIGFDACLLHDVRRALSTTFGCLAAIFSRALAAPSGYVRPCSQLRRVPALTPIK